MKINPGTFHYPGIKSNLIRNFLLCAFSALLYGLASPNTNYHLLCWILLIPFLETLEGASLRLGFLYGWQCGTMIHLINFYWLIGTIYRFSNLNLSLSVIAWILFALLAGLAFGAMTFIFLLLREKQVLPDLIIFPACYTAMEFLFPFIFPWHLGAFLYRIIPLIQISDLCGIYGITTLVVTVNYFFWETFRFLCKRQNFPYYSLVVILLFFSATTGYGFWRINAIEKKQHHPPQIIIGIIQPNISMEEIQSAILEKDIWKRYRLLSKKAVQKGAQLIVWPESAVNFSYNDQGLPYSSSGLIKNLVRSLDKPFLFGAWATESTGLRNSAYLIDSAGNQTGRHDKVRLLPFGERLPFSDRFPLIKKWIQGGGNFTKGEKIAPLCMPISCFGVLICYEGTINDISRDLVNQGAKFLINITNDAWFGRTRCPEQHLMLSSFRAVENRVWLIRAANTGISAAVDPIGRILHRTVLYEQAFRTCPIKILEIPTLYKRWGNWLPISFTIVLAFLLLSTLISMLRAIL